MFTVRRGSGLMLVTGLLVALASSYLLFGRGDTEAGAAEVFQAHGGLVPDEPRRDLPVIRASPPANHLPRQVLAAEQVGRLIVAGGDFLEVERTRGGDVLDQPYLVAFGVDTGELACEGRLMVDGEVLAIEPGPEPTQAYIGGRFNRITGADGVDLPRPKLALVDFADCSVVRSFAVWNLDAKIDEIELVGDRLFVGGDFTRIGDNAITALAEVDALSGTVNQAFSFAVTGALSSKVRGMEVNPAGDRLILGGRFNSLARNGVSVTSQTAIIDISDRDDPVLTQHSFSPPHPEWGDRAWGSSLQDVAVSPDGSHIGLAYGTATISDYVYLVPAVPTPTEARWSKYMQDSSFGIGVSDHAVYVAGHFCRIVEGPGATDLMAPNGLSVCSGAFMAGQAWRTQLAALDINDGTPLTWNPGNDARVGGRTITVTSRGLLVGFDGRRTNQLRTGALAVFDFGPQREDPVPPSPVTFASPTAGADLDNPITFDAMATDEGLGIARYELVLRSTDDRWWEFDQGWSTERVVNEIEPNDEGRLEREAFLPAGGWLVSARAVDQVGNVSEDWTQVWIQNAGADPIAPEVVFEQLGQSLDAGAPVRLSGEVTDNLELASVSIALTYGDGRYVTPDGLSAEPYTYGLDLPTPGVGSAPWELSFPEGLEPGSYELRIIAVDRAENPVESVFPLTANAIVTTPSKAFSSYTTGSTFAGPYTVGFRFTVSEPRWLTSLGLFDVNGNGVLDNTAPARFGVWKLDDPTALATGVVPVGTPADGQWFYAPFDEQVLLEPGVTYIVGHQVHAVGESASWLSTPTPTPGSVLTVVSDAWANGTELTYPDRVSDPDDPEGVPNLVLESRRRTSTEVSLTEPTGSFDFEDQIPVAGRVTGSEAPQSVTVSVRDSAGRYLDELGAVHDEPVTLPVGLVGMGTPTVEFSITLPALDPDDYTVIATALDSRGFPFRATRELTVSDTVWAGGPAIESYAAGATFSGPRVIGYRFTVTEARRLSSLGVFDTNGNGTLDNLVDTDIAVWEFGNEEPLATATLPPGAAAAGGWAYGALEEPIMLRPGITYVVAHQVHAEGEQVSSESAPTLAANSPLQIIGASQVWSQELAYPRLGAGTVPWGVANMVLESAVAFAPGAEPDPAPVIGCQVEPAADGGALIRWEAVVGEDSYQVRRNGRWLVTLSETSYIDPGAQADSFYVIRNRINGQLIERTCEGDPVGEQLPSRCDWEAGEGRITLTWTPVAGEDSYQVRRNDVWMATVDGTSWVDENPVEGAEYVIRNRIDGQIIDRPCL